MRRLFQVSLGLLLMCGGGFLTTAVWAQTPLLDSGTQRSAFFGNAASPPEGTMSLLSAPQRESLPPTTRQVLRPVSAGPAAKAVSKPVQSSTRDPIFRRSAAEVRMDRLLSRPRGEQVAEEADRELRGFGVDD